MTRGGPRLWSEGGSSLSGLFDCAEGPPTRVAGCGSASDTPVGDWGAVQRHRRCSWHSIEGCRTPTHMPGRGRASSTWGALISPIRYPSGQRCSEMEARDEPGTLYPFLSTESVMLVNPSALHNLCRTLLLCSISGSLRSGCLLSRQTAGICLGQPWEMAIAMLAT